MREIGSFIYPFQVYIAAVILFSIVRGYWATLSPDALFYFKAWLIITGIISVVGSVYLRLKNIKRLKFSSSQYLSISISVAITIVLLEFLVREA
jgi:hypothetical protein